MSLPSAVQSVIELFQGPLCNVRFADVDAAGLAHLAAEVEAAAAEVEAREAALVELRQSLAQRHEALQALAHQALAYARVYAENNDEQLLDVVAGINLSRAPLPRGAGSAKAAKGRKPSKAGPRDSPAAERETEAERDATEAEPEALASRSNGSVDASADAEPESVEADVSPSGAPARGARKGRPRATHAATS